MLDLPFLSQKLSIRSVNLPPIINYNYFSGPQSRNIIFYCVSHSVAVRELAHKTVLPPNRIFYVFDRIMRGRHATRVLGSKHGQIIEMIPGRKDVLTPQPKQPRHFRQGGSLIVSHMAEAGINIIADDREVGDAPGVILKKSMDDIRLSI